ncbi:MAG: hypothetical protein COA96_04515 [SAR86 cluster bacterium]|uniref:DUF2135 domain-containing protein n=1 Tax=SAR86 cluster bacterium TaxID=2030880 RepID=A0A2A5B5R7_9GAMM|nr:MAG: hypothetical protein COA96_04515 [SAR86 cluster bacterium]
MKRKNREINIFSMSALDLFASALGAFILITIVLFPFYPNTGDSPERIADVRAEVEAEIRALEVALQAAQLEAQNNQSQLSAAVTQVASIQQELGSCSTSLDAIENDFDSCRIAMAQTFVLVVVSWGSADDVDLHIIDPRGNEYYYADERFDGSEAALEEDNTRGPGNEIWLSPRAIPGDYEIYLNMFSKSDDAPVSVRGSILHQEGRIALPDTSLSSEGQKPLVATFTVSEEGTVTIR